jgi:DNA-binding response OmpR family regulator
MSETDYARASVLLFDPVHVNQRTTRYALFELGFRNIECVSNLKEFREAIAETGPDLIVAESSGTDVDVFKTIRAVRRSELGENPFLVVLVTTWNRDTSHISKAMSCGADDVILRPFSTVFVEERVRTLVRNRKDFVVTSDYIGPDRRSDTKRSSSAPAVSVPNFLRATVDGDTKALTEAQKWIEEARKTVNAERLRRLAMRIVIAVELELSDTPDDTEKLALDFNDLGRTAREMRAQLTRAKRPEAAEVAEALIEQVTALSTAADLPQSGLRLIKDLAMGAYAAYANGESIERSKNEIGKTVTNLRKRLRARAAEAAQRDAEGVSEKPAKTA